MAKIKVNKRVVKKNESDVKTKTASSVNSSVSFGKKLLSWIGWGIIYVFVFYLGNLSGEYVAAHLPILPSLPRVSFDANKLKQLVPRISLPKVTVAWKWPVKAPKSAPVVTHTTLVIVRGNFINMPTSGATEAEKKAYIDSVESLVVDASEIMINDSCEVNPAFIRVKKGSTMQVKNTSTQEHSITIEGKPYRVASKQNASVTLAQSEGAYPISCDGVVAGFYRIN